MHRRTFLASALATTVLPGIVEAEAKPFDPRPQYVRIKKDFLPGQMLVVPRRYYLYFVTDQREAIRYGVGVGRAGLQFQGVASIDVKKEWPTWRPTDEMIERDPVLYQRFVGNEEAQPGGPTNPLGARALYLFQDGRDTFFRIHGTTEPQSIGQSVSNGCIRMLNAHVIDLYERVPIGTVVTVL
ncbi:L,D-transpeptidase [Sulfitobacter sp. D35]|uniref:L,D-transpeptidase n=1 Tax=Sulfitobacter sp. D35 TaxID=3083252 RepID=UPI00296FB805|nr:L,D-transpeptidase [Sulfitobacter sp. D35]MDW4498432.1 L,D-transpeptidase [Sulfitobacter sp. D35]